jgi:DNA-binding response OmpR family regulator
MQASFGRFVFDSDTRQEFRGEQPVEISPKKVDLLERLIGNRPRALLTGTLTSGGTAKTVTGGASSSQMTMPHITIHLVR